MGKFTLVCTACRAIQSTPYSPFCPKCNTMTEAEYDLSAVTLHDSDNPYLRYYDLIPVNDKSLLPQQAVCTSTVHAKRLGALLGMDELYLKNETEHNTGTTKYRMAAVALPYLFESGIRHFCTSSTGNSSTAYAQLISNIPELKMSLFTGSAFRDRVNYADNPQITHHIFINGTFVEAFDYASVYAAEHGYTGERGFFNVGRREGLKLAFFEAVDQIRKPIDWYVQGVSSAMGVYGTYKGARELLGMKHIDRLPRLLCAQQETCSPMVDAWHDNSPVIEKKHIVQNPSGIAKAILRGNPSRVYPYMRKIVQHSGGDFVKVTELEMRAARSLVKDLENIDICFSAATAVAGLIKSVRSGSLSVSDRVLINLTGSDRAKEEISDDVIFWEKVNNAWQQVTDKTAAGA